MSESKPETNITENSVSIRMPNFSFSNPRIWFVQLELYFRNQRITSQNSRFEVLSTLLPEKVALEVIDILQDPPTTDAYNILKEAILARTAASEEACLQRLLSGVELGDRTPSQLLRHMRTLAGSNRVNDSVLRSLWIKCLPSNTRLILSAQEEGTTLDALAKTADKVHECFFSTGVNALSTPSTSQETQSDRIQQLIDKMDAFDARLNAISQQQAPRSRRNSRPRSRSRATDPKPSNLQGHGVCYYHRRFGDNARKCTLPCTHPKAFNNFAAQGKPMASQ